MMFRFFCCSLLCMGFITALAQPGSTSYAANHPQIRITGRVSNEQPQLPRFWAPGVYIELSFRGDSCTVLLGDEMKWGTNHNSVEIQVDNEPSYKVWLTGKDNVLHIAANKKQRRHKLTITKNTEADMGYLELRGVRCSKLLPLPKAPSRRIEFFGNSITCGTGMDTQDAPCNTGQWYDQHRASKAYGPLTAQKLNAQWQLSSVSGIGLIHSCCNKTTVMPQVYNKINMTDNALPWSFSRYQPDVVTICLGQNDGIQDSVAFTKAYIQLLQQMQQHYPRATFILLNSPMAHAELNAVLQRYILAVVQQSRQQGISRITHYFYSQRYASGCDSHPTMAEHAQMAEELSAFVAQTMDW